MFWNIFNIMPTALDSGKNVVFHWLNYVLDLKLRFNLPGLDLSDVQGFYHPKKSDSFILPTGQSKLVLWP